MPRIYASLSPDLEEVKNFLKKFNKYRDDTELVQGAIRYMGLTWHKKHHRSTEWAAMSPTERDTFDAQLLANIKAKKKMSSQSWDAKIKRLIREVMAETGREPTVEEVSEKLGPDVV